MLYGADSKEVLRQLRIPYFRIAVAYKALQIVYGKTNTKSKHLMFFNLLISFHMGRFLHPSLQCHEHQDRVLELNRYILIHFYVIYYICLLTKTSGFHDNNARK